MTIRHALHRQALLAAELQGRKSGKPSARWCSPTIIVLITGGILALVNLVEYLHG